MIPRKIFWTFIEWRGGNIPPGFVHCLTWWYHVWSSIFYALFFSICPGRRLSSSSSSNFSLLSFSWEIFTYPGI